MSMGDPEHHDHAEFEGDDSETLVAEQGVKLDATQAIEAPVSIPEPVSSVGADVNKSMLDRALGVNRTVPFAIAIGLHVVVFGAAILIPRIFWHSTRMQKPIIAKLVTKGKPRDKNLMPTRPEPAPPLPSPRAAIPAPNAPPAPAAKPSKLASNDVKPVPAKKPLSRAELMARALAGVDANVEKDRKERPVEKEGAEDGSEEGTAASAEEGDQYFAAVQAAILANYVLPSIISETERMTLKATLVAYIARDGTIVRHEFEKRSGNKFFDDALELAIKRSKVPPPPPDREKTVREGVALVFTP
ncbi:MAG: TonB C-terminal domain-containing protein [Deltaproteobacteria bacterium]|nr:TonB C-terminal domain-containing protein [Deltaproteobacteria bacterium]